jgi:hypothetical protein
MHRELVEEILSFVKARRKVDGGYGATPLLPATIEDSYHALRILETIGKSAGFKRLTSSLLKDESLRDYLIRSVETEWVSARTAFRVLYSRRLVGLPSDPSLAVAFLSRRPRKRLSLQERYYRARILREVLGSTIENTRKKPSPFAPRRWRTASELLMRLYLATPQGVRQSPVRGSLISWLRACQTSDGGFGFFPGTTSYIENCHTCLRALAILQAKPLGYDNCLHFVLACRTGSGGFARKPGAAPFLDATWHAVAAFFLLEIL